MKLRKILAIAGSAIVAVSALAISASAANAYIIFQTGSYCFRNNFDDPSYGRDTKYYDSFIVWGDDTTNPDTFGDDYADMFDYDINGYVLPATYKDAVLDKDGTYTISAETEFGIKKDTALNFLKVSTDIEVTQDDLDNGAYTFGDAKIIVDGEVAATVTPVPEISNGYLQLNLVNIWNTDTAAYSGAYPTKSLAIEFSITGLGAGAADGAEATGDKANSDTGVEGIAVVAGLAVVAAGAIVVAKKRK